MPLTPLKTERDTFAEDVIARLEEMLAVARSTPQKAISIQMMGRDGQLKYVHTATSLVEHIGMLEITKFNLLRKREG